MNSDNLTGSTLPSEGMLHIYPQLLLAIMQFQQRTAATGQVLGKCRWLLTTIILYCLVNPLIADQFGDLTFSSNGTSITITGYTGTGGAVVIPSTINSLPVTDIGVSAFQGNQLPRSISIPLSVTSIGANAFGGCSNLVSLTIPESVKTIGIGAIGSCARLAAITVDIANPSYSSLDGVLFNKTRTKMIQYPAGKSGGYTIPNTVTSFDNAFQGCDQLSSLVIPSSVTTIPESEFSNFHELASVTIASGPTSIGTGAFYGCYKLSSISIPNSVTSIGSSAFRLCHSLIAVTIPPSVTNIGLYAFMSCNKLLSISVDPSNIFYSSVDGMLLNKAKTIIIACPAGKSGNLALPDSVIRIQVAAFSDCDLLTSVVAVSGLTVIESSAFSGCSALTTVSIPESVTEIGAGVFPGCVSLVSIMVNPLNQFFSSIEGLLYDKNQTVLLECPSAKSGSILIPATVTLIQVAAFWTCANLDSIAVDAQNKNFSSVNGVLLNKDKTHLIQCPRKKTGTYTIPTTVTSIGDRAFYYADINGVVLPTSINSIGFLAFYGSDISEMVIPNGLKTIDRNMFDGCKFLERVEIPNSITSIGDSAFYFCSSLNRVIIPESVTKIGYSAFGYCSSLSRVIIPASVTSIDNFAFSFCSSLSSVRFIGNAPSMVSGVFSGAAASFRLEYSNGATGFTSPTWMGYPAVNIGIPIAWVFDGSGWWSTAANWSSGVADGAGISADFETIDISADRTVNLDSPRSLGHLFFGDTYPSSSGGWTLANSGNPANVLTLPGEKPSITVNTLATGKGVLISAALACSHGLTKLGPGTLTLTGPNTCGGEVFIQAGILRFGGNTANLGPGSVTNHGTLAFNLQAPVTISNGLSGTGGLRQEGPGTLTLTGANTCSGGILISAGTVAVSNASGLGSGSVTNNATLSLTAGAVTYSGLSSILGGSGTVNVKLGTGTATTNLDGNYSGFTGTWNIGTSASAGAGKVRMNGADNAAATVNVLTNGTVFINSGTHNASIVLNGGDTGESLGQLRIDNGAIWAGSVTLAGAITGSGDGLVGSNTGQTGTIRGNIGETGGARRLSKAGLGTIILSGINTYTGDTSISGGTLVLADNGRLKFVVTSGSNNRITGTGTVTLNGDFLIDTSSVTVSSGNWTLVDVATLSESYGTTFTVAGTGWTGTSDVWTKTDGARRWKYTESSGVLSLSTIQLPLVATGTATAITASVATLGGTVNPNGFATTALFEYGLTTAYGGTASVTLSPANGTTAQAVGAVISGLQPGQTYHYRLTATNSGGTGTGADMTFNTQTASTPSATWLLANGFSADTNLLSDSDQDGIPLLLEYAMAGQPKASDTNLQPAAGRAGGYLTLTYRQNKTATDLTYLVEAGDSLTAESWLNATNLLSQADMGDYWLITIRDNVPIADNAKRFMRLKVIQ